MYVLIIMYTHIYYVQNIYVLACMLSCSVTLDSATPWTVASQAPLSMIFPRQEYWSGLLFPSLRDLPSPGIRRVSPILRGRFFTIEPSEKNLVTFN